MAVKKKAQPQCGKRNKNCRKCAHHYAKGDKSWECPKCGEDRHCHTPRVVGLETCRMHGGKGGVQPGPKYVLGENLTSRINRLLRHPELFEMGNEIAVNQLRMNELLELTENMGSGLASRFDEGLAIAREGARSHDQGLTESGLNIVIDALAEEKANSTTWRELREHLKLHNLMITSYQKMMVEQEQMVTTLQLVEVISSIQRIMFRVITNADDRQWVVREMREFFGHDNELDPIQ